MADFEPERLQRKDALGETWRAFDRRRGIKVDMRLLPSWADLDLLENWLGQAKEAAHPAIVATLRLVRAEDGRAAVVLEACDGETIPQRRARRPRRHFEVSEIKPWLRQVVEAVETLHTRGLCHGSLHTGSFLIDGTDLKLNDLAVSRLMRPQPRLEGAAALPLTAMSPQVLQGDPPSVADDLYALGTFVYDLLTGGPAFHSGDIPTQILNARPASVMIRRSQLEIQSLPLPQAWEDWLQAALSKDPAQRPGVGELAELVRSGAFRGASTAARPVTAFSASGTIPAQPAMPGTGATEHGPRAALLSRLSPNQWIVTIAAMLILGIGSVVYLGRIAPRNAFKKNLTDAFTRTQAFDDEHGNDHRAAIAQWEGLLEEWRPGVTMAHPEFQPILDAAKEKMEEHQSQLKREAELAKAEADEARRQYIAKVRAQFISAQAQASAATDRSGSITAWAAFLKLYDVPYQGETLTETSREIAEARTAHDGMVKAAEEEKKMITEARARAEADLARLHQQLSDPASPAVMKITLVEGYLSTLGSLPAAALADSGLAELRKTAEGLVQPLRMKAETETPKDPLDLAALFPDGTARTFSENGRKRLVAAAQARLKEAGVYQGETDGALGKATHEAIITFQKSRNLVPSATLDERTLAALGVTGLKDDPTPMAAAVATVRRASSRSKKQEPEEKGFFRKVGDGAANVGKSIGGFFSGKDDDKEKKKKK